MSRNTFHVPEFFLPASNLIFLADGEKRFIYGDLYQLAHQLESEASRLHISESNPLLIFSEPSAESVFLIAAAFLSKTPILPLHPETSNAELNNILDLIKPAAFFGSGESHQDFTNNTPALKISPEFDSQNSDSELIKFQFDAPDQVAGYFLTSGSTGTPKIVPVKRRQVFFAARASSENIKPVENKYWLLCLPLNHVGGINVIYRSLLYNSAIYLAQSFDADRIHSLLNENKDFEAASMVPTMLDMLLENSFFRVQFNFKGLLLGGGPISMDLINRSLTRGIPIVTSYGMTETCAQIAANPMLKPRGDYTPKQSVGRIFEPNQIEIRTESGQALPYNESGIIWLKGPQVFDGYLDESHNKGAFDFDGWLNTGDYGHLNRKNQLFIETRRTDLIITGGENVNPAEMEEWLLKQNEIREAAVVGIPDKKWGQKVVAFLVIDPDTFDMDSLKIELKEQVRRYKIPKEIILTQSLPKTDTLKVKKGELLKIYNKQFNNESS